MELNGALSLESAQNLILEITKQLKHSFGITKAYTKTHMKFGNGHGNLELILVSRSIWANKSNAINNFAYIST